MVGGRIFQKKIFDLNVCNVKTEEERNKYSLLITLYYCVFPYYILFL